MPPRQPPVPWEPPERPWSRMHIDFADPLNGVSYLILVDAYSKCPEIAPLNPATVSATIAFLRRIFSQYGLPEVLVSDNVSQFTSSSFEDFCRQHNIQHLRSPPYHPQSNGQAESFVDTFKRALWKARGEGMTDEIVQAFLFSYRTTPNPVFPGGVSPAEASVGRKLRTTFHALVPTVAQLAQTSSASRSKLSIGTPVFVRDYRAGFPDWIEATVVAHRDSMLYDVDVSDDIWVRHHNQIRRRHCSKTTGLESVPSLSLDILLDTFAFPADRSVPQPTAAPPSDVSPSVSVTAPGSPGNKPRLRRRTNRVRRSTLPMQTNPLARFYGLPKVHKDGAPLRPIVSLKGTPTYKLAKWTFRRLKFLTAESDTTVSSSAQFLEKLKGVSLHPNEVMVPFDVTALFTSIPQDLAIETIELLLQSKYHETENRLGRAQVLQLLKFCRRTYFTFDGTIYEQVKGTPMGSSISGFIAEAVLQRLESLVFQHHKPKFWARYVDDTFVVIDRDQLLTFKERLNAVFPDIQFTMEEEENNQLAFLDVLVCRKDCGGLKTKVFRKATNTIQVLNFNSNHPVSHKRSCVRTLYRRVETHCSEPEDKIAELQYLRRVFKANGYPRNFVNRCIRKRDERPNRTDTKVWRALPYVKNVSEAVGRLLAPLGVGVAHRPEATIRRQIMKPKDPLPRLETSGVVYRIRCSCGQSNYVRETGRRLQTRMAEHAEQVRRNDASSQVAANSTRSGHTFKFDEAEILARGDNRVSRELLESWFTGAQSINKCTDLPVQYSVLRLRLGGVLGHAVSAQVNTRPNTRLSASDGRAIITPASNSRDEIAAINDANVGHHATCNDP
ncbi:hypothetical protein SprV_0100056100 [Sparganum proliferum]